MKDKPKRSTITICSSVSFYEEIPEIQKQLTKMGFKVLIPYGVSVKRKKKDNENTGNSGIKTPYDYAQKKKLMDKHFRKILKADAILVINKTKHNLEGYIGGNVLMEMTLAYHHKKKIFILNTIDEKLTIKQEIYALFPTFLHSNLTYLSSSIPSHYNLTYKKGPLEKMEIKMSDR